MISRYLTLLYSVLYSVFYSVRMIRYVFFLLLIFLCVVLGYCVLFQDRESGTSSMGEGTLASFFTDIPSKLYHGLHRQNDFLLPQSLIPVKRGIFTQEVRGRGYTESMVNTDVVCSVDGFTPIVYLLPEGTIVKTGDILAMLDTQESENELFNRTFRYLKLSTWQMQRVNSLRKAEIALEEYICGTFEKEWLQLENKIFDYHQTLKQSDERLRYTERLVRIGYSSKAQVDVYRANKEDAANNLKKVQLDEEVLLKFSSENTITDLIATIEQNLLSLDFINVFLELRKQSLTTMMEQVEMCTIRAPVDGELIYANQLVHRHPGEDELIRVGASVYNGQLMFRIPDSHLIQINTLVNESDISKIEKGMSATLFFGLISPVVFTGTVHDVNRYPEFVWQSSAKNYIVNVQIDDPDAVRNIGIELRTGLSADVNIKIDEMKDVLTVPLNALLYYGSKVYCLTWQDNLWGYKEVLLGPSNEESVVIKEGLQEGDLIVEQAYRYAGQVSLPGILTPSLYQTSMKTHDENAQNKSEDNKPENSKSEDGKPENSKPEDGKAEDSKPEDSKADETKKNDLDKSTEEIPVLERKKKEARKLLLDLNTKYAPIAKYYDKSTMEMYRLLDKDGNKTITREEVQKAAPEFLQFYDEWDRDKDSNWQIVDFVLGYYHVRNLYREMKLQSEDAETKVEKVEKRSEIPSI